MEFRILGPFEVSDGGAAVEVPRRKQRALLAALALRAGGTVSTDRLVEDLWGENPPPRAVGSLQNTVSQLRRLLGPDVVVTRPPGYSLAIPREHVDLGQFERLVGYARTATAADRAATLREALALWRGPPLADLAFEPFAALVVTRLNELRVAAQEELVDAELALGHHRELVGEIESLVAEHPLRERLRGLLILALYRSGRQAEALEAYRAAREMLVEELGIDPSPELQRLEQAILRHDPELELEHAAASQAEPMPPPEQARRKTVTVLFADLVDPTAIAAELDPEALRVVMARYFDAARTAVQSHGGTVEKFIGDAVAAVFGLPELHEDDALRAVRAAQDLRTAVSTVSKELERERHLTLAVRIGVSSGEVVVGGPAGVGALASGAAVSVARCLEQAALPGEILIGPETLELVRGAVAAEPVEPVELGGGAGAVQAFRVVSVEDEAAVPARSLAAPLVGREAELAQLRDAFAAVRDQRRSRVLTVLGEAGIGKTRLAGEFLSALPDDALAIVGRCVPYGEGATYLPLASALRTALPRRSEAVAALLAGGDQSDLVAQRLAEVMGEGAGGAPPGEIAWAVRRLLEALARERPLVLVVEDVHWAEPTLLDLVEYLGEWGSDAPVLVLCLARPELLERRPGWEAGSVRLGPLSDAHARMLVGNLASLPDADSARVVEAAEGNPLFLEQLTVYAGERGGLDRMPPSVEAVLAGRLERLPLEERRVLEWAAVVGKVFSRAAVSHLAEEDAAAVDRCLMALIRRGFLRAGRESAPAEDSIRFHHALVREVAYGGIPKEARAELHERLAAWLEERPEATDELVGYHLEQAHRYRAEVRPGDAALPRLAEQAGRRLGNAGIRAWKRTDAPAAINLLGRATALLPPDDAQRIESLCELGLALRIAGEYERAGNVLAEAVAAAVEVADRRLELRARLEQAAGRLATDPEGASDEVLELADAAIPVFENLCDDRALGRAWLLAGTVEGGFRCRNAAWQEAAERALVHYRSAGWPVAWCVGGVAAALFHGPAPVPSAIERCRDLLADAAIGRLGTAEVELFLAGLHAMQGRFAEARTLVDRSAAAYDELGAASLSAQDAGPIRARIEALSGDTEAAERALRTSCEELAKMGEAAALATRRAQLADVVYSQGHHDEAEALANLAKDQAAGDDLPTQFLWRAVLAKVLARRGSFDEAERLARAAVELAQRTDALNQQAQVRLDLAEVLVHAGRSREARTLIADATRLFRRKGNLVGVRRARSLLDGPALDRRGRPYEDALR